MSVRENMRWDGLRWVSSFEVADRRLADGPVTVYFGEAADHEPLTPDAAAMIDAAEHDFDRSVLTAVNAIYGAYPKLQEKSPFDEDEFAQYMPDLESVEDLYPLLKLDCLDIHLLARDGIHYVGVVFSCTWEIEHGVGVMLNGDRVVDIGGADSALNRWVAERDLESHS